MKKILYISDYNFSGYTLVTNCLLKSIINKYKIYLLVINNSLTKKELLKKIYNELKLPNDQVFIVNPICVKKLTNNDINKLCGCEIIPQILKNINPDIIFTINDLQIINRQIDTINKCYYWSGIKIAYMPVDAENYVYNFFKNLYKFNHIITMNNNSKKTILNTGFFNHIYVLEHPIANNFKILKNKYSLRKKFFNNIINDNDIIIMNSNGNDIRKKLDITLHSFYLLHKKYSTYFKKINKNIFLVLKTVNNGYYNFENIIDNYNTKYNINLSNNIILNYNKYNYDDLNKLYNCADVYLTTTSGEGWGLTAFEFLSLNIWSLVPNSISYIDYFPKKLLLDTQIKTIGESRLNIKKINNNIYWLFMNFKKNKNYKLIFNNNIITSYSNKIIIDNKNIKDIFKLIDTIKMFDSGEVYIYIDATNNFTFVEKIINQFNKIKLENYLENYHINIRELNCLDAYITKVKEPKLNNIVNKLIYYIKNQELCNKEIKKISQNIFNKLNNDKICKDFNNILKDIGL